MRLDVGALKVGTRPTASSSFTNIYSLNANANVRNCYFKNIYTPGVFDLEKEGGVFAWWKGGCVWDIFGSVD